MENGSFGHLSPTSRKQLVLVFNTELLFNFANMARISRILLLLTLVSVVFARSLYDFWYNHGAEDHQELAYHQETPSHQALSGVIVVFSQNAQPYQDSEGEDDSGNPQIEALLNDYKSYIESLGDRVIHVYDGTLFYGLAVELSSLQNTISQINLLAGQQLNTLSEPSQIVGGLTALLSEYRAASLDLLGISLDISEDRTVTINNDHYTGVYDV